jgi:hypothetical protein
MNFCNPKELSTTQEATVMGIHCNLYHQSIADKELQEELRKPTSLFHRMYSCCY